MTNKLKLDCEILDRLYWKDKLSLPEIGKMYNLNPTSVLKRMKKYGISRRPLSESNYIVYRHKPKFEVKKNLGPEDELLKIAGIMLYWSEGSFKGDGIDFANSNPDIIILFLKFLRNICGIAEKRLRVYLYAFSDQDIKKLKSFWSNITNIPLNRFNKPYIRKVSKLHNRRMSCGLVKIRYSDKKLLKLLKNWLGVYRNRALMEMGRWPRGQWQQTVKTQRPIEK